MSNFKQKPNTGALFKNKKRKTDKHPEYNGTALINGVEMWVSGWVNESVKGQKYFSLAFTEKKSNQANQSNQQPSQSVQHDDYGIPF